MAFNPNDFHEDLCGPRVGQKPDLSPEQARDRLLNWVAEGIAFLLEERARLLEERERKSSQRETCEDIIVELSLATATHEHLCLGGTRK